MDDELLSGYIPTEDPFPPYVHLKSRIIVGMLNGSIPWNEGNMVRDALDNPETRERAVKFLSEEKEVKE